MKTMTDIKNEKPVYYVCIDGKNYLESFSIKECKEFLIKYLKSLKKNGIKILNTWDYYIGMYSIDIEDEEE